MKEFQRKRKIRKFLYSPSSFVILLVLVALMAKATWNVYVKEKDSQKNLDHAKEELAALESRKTMLSDKISRLKTPQGLEAEIRSQFQVVKPGEKMVVVVEGKNAKDEVAQPAPSLISRFFDLFK